MSKTITKSSTMSEAFRRMRISDRTLQTHSKIIVAAGAALSNHVGERQVPEWNAHLKYRTYQSLKSQGIMQ